MRRLYCRPRLLNAVVTSEYVEHFLNLKLNTSITVNLVARAINLNILSCSVCCFVLSVNILEDLL